MPDTRSDLREKGAETIVPPAGQPVQCKPSALQRWFPSVACVLGAGGMAAVTYSMDQASAVGKLTGMPYVLLALLFGAIFVANYFVYRED